MTPEELRTLLALVSITFGASLTALVIVSAKLARAGKIIKDLREHNRTMEIYTHEKDMRFGQLLQERYDLQTEYDDLQTAFNTLEEARAEEDRKRREATLRGWETRRKNEAKK